MSHLNNNNNPYLDNLLNGRDTIATPEVTLGRTFEVSVGIAVKLLYPLLEQEFQFRGYSKSHISYRLSLADEHDLELVDLIECVISEFDDYGITH
jgi:hypothetical protein